MKVKIHHADHGISEEQQNYINGQLAKQPDGFFIRRVDIPESLGLVPCGLYGPEMGDEPVRDFRVTLIPRGERGWADRMIDGEEFPFRDVDYVHAIGIKDGDNLELFTVYGGPLAPQNPLDPSNQDVEGAKKFWAEHALATVDLDSLELIRSPKIHSTLSRHFITGAW